MARKDPTGSGRNKRRVAFGILGSVLDRGAGDKRWQRWRPTVGLCSQKDLPIDRLELLVQPDVEALAEVVAGDVAAVSPRTQVVPHLLPFSDPWDFEEVYDTLFTFARAYPFDEDHEEYLVHLTTGSHVQQICLFLLCESRFVPGKLVQSKPSDDDGHKTVEGGVHLIDLDLGRYDRIAARFADLSRDAVSFLKQGIPTRSARFNQLMDDIERVARSSTAPILLTGPTGAGKTQLARRIYELKRERRRVLGAYVEVNCATLRGDQAMSTLFGHKKGAFTGADKARDGLLRAADGGLLFLDEVGELGLDEQAMLLHALETGRYLPLGSDEERKSDFQLIAGTNRDLGEAVRRGRFREDLLARIDLWAFELPGLWDRKEDIEPNLDFELERFARKTGARVTLSAEARARFLAFALSEEASWRGSFRDLSATVTRMATLAPGGRITEAVVADEIARLGRAWARFSEPARGELGDARDGDARLERLLGEERARQLDRFERVQLLDVLSVCRRARSLSEAGRTLFAASRAKKASANDADRLRKYLARYGLSFPEVAEGSPLPVRGASC